MKTILVPVDFSIFSENALLLSIIFARAFNAKIILCHVVQVPIAMGEVPFALLEKEKDELKKEAEIKIKAQTLHINHAGNISHETKILDGEIVAELLSFAGEVKADLVIMGTKGVKNVQDIILGSITEQMIQKSDCPVLAVPETINFNKTIKHLTFATDYHKSDIIDILKLIEMASTLKAQVNILHVSGDDMSAEQEVKMMGDFMKIISDKTNYNNLSFQILHGNNILQKLKDYLKEESTDILVTAAHHRGLMDRLFAKSYTLELLKDSKIPIIAFHFNQKNN